MPDKTAWERQLMSFLRPEATATLMRWREALVGAAVAGVGLWWVLGPGLLLTIPGAALVIAGLGLLWIGVQRGRFRADGAGLGQVQIDEGQITYFGPLTGGSVALREMVRLTLHKHMRPDHWELDQPGQAPVLIPVNALGADGLFDAFSTLPGLRTERMLHALQERGGQAVVIWEKHASRPAHLALH